MSSADTITCTTNFPKEDCNYTWVIDDFPSLWKKKADAEIMSPILNVGSSDRVQFQLKFYKACEDHNRYKLKLCCRKKNAEQPYKYNISAIKDGEILHTKSNYIFRTDCDDVDIFYFVRDKVKKLISSKKTIIIHCALAVFTLDNNHLLNYEYAISGKVPKLKFDWIFLDDNLSDVRLKAACGKKIPAHRIVLAAASPIFKAMLSHDAPESEIQAVDVTDVNYEAAVEMLRYIYTGTAAENLKISQTIDLLAAADSYQFEELKIECEKILISHLSAENALEIHKVADFYGAKHLKKE